MCDGWDDLRNATFSAEHRFPVDPHNQHSGSYEREGVIGLCVGPEGVDDLKMKQCRE